MIAICPEIKMILRVYPVLVAAKGRAGIFEKGTTVFGDESARLNTGSASYKLSILFNRAAQRLFFALFVF
jgi:hypothetical protein